MTRSREARPSTARRRKRIGVTVELPVALAERIRLKAAMCGVSEADLIKVWLYDKAHRA